MLRKIVTFAVLAFSAAAAHAVPYDILFQQRWADGSPGFYPNLLNEPPGLAFFGYDPVTHTPQYFLVGSGLDCSPANVFVTIRTCTITVGGASVAWADVTGKPAFGTAALANTASSGNAAATEVVLGSDSRMTDARTPTAHVHSGADITSGTVAAARLPSLAISQTTGLQAAIDAKADASALSSYITASVANAAFYPLASNPSGYLLPAALSPYLTSASASSTYAAKATTRAGYGITDAQATLTLTTTGSGVATLTGATLNIPPQAAAATTAVIGTTVKTGSFRVYQSGTVSTAGTMVFQLTADGTSTGAALFPNETFTDSVQPIVSDATASYQYAWAFTNSNKTLTVTVNKLTTANILSGILGQAGAPIGTVVKIVVEGR